MTKDLTKGTPWKVILIYAIPILIGNLFQQLYNMADTVIVGNILGLDALAAVGSTGVLMFLILGFTMGLTSGFAVPVAQMFGAGQEKKLRHFVGLTVIWSAVVAGVMTIVAGIFCKPLLKLINTPENIIDQAYIYILIIFLGQAFSMLYNTCASLLRAVGDSRTPLYFLIFSCLLNIGLDYLMIGGLKMGVAGAAVATITAQGISGILCVFLISRRFPVLHLSKEDFNMDWGMTKTMFGIGLPMAFQFSITAIGALVLQSTVNSFGSTVVGAQTAAAKIQFLAEQPYQAVCATIATYVAQNIGAGRYDRVRTGMRNCYLIILLSGAFAFFMLRVPSEALLRLFVSDISEEAVKYAMINLKVSSIFTLFLGYLFLFRNALQGAGLPVIPLWGGVIEFFARILVCLIANHLNVATDTRYLVVCMASPSAWIGACIILFVRYVMFAREINRRESNG